MNILLALSAFFLFATLMVSESKKNEVAREESISKMVGFAEYKSRVDGIRRVYKK